MDITIVNVLNWISVVLGIVAIPLNMYRKTAVWPISIVSNVVNLLLYYQKNSYSRMITILVMIPLNLYGWYTWKWKKEKGYKEKLITITPWYIWGLLLLIFLGGSYIFYLLLGSTTSPTPISGAASMMMLFIGSWLSAEKKLESGIFWAVYNLLSFTQHHWLGMRLKWKYVIYCLLSPYTYYLWRKAYLAQKKTQYYATKPKSSASSSLDS